MNLTEYKIGKKTIYFRNEDRDVDYVPNIRCDQYFEHRTKEPKIMISFDTIKEAKKDLENDQY